MNHISLSFRGTNRRDPFVPFTYVVTAMTGLAALGLITIDYRLVVIPCAFMFGWIQIGGL